MDWFVFYYENIDVNIHILCSEMKKKLSNLVSNMKDNNLDGVFEFVEAFIDQNWERKKNENIICAAHNHCLRIQQTLVGNYYNHSSSSYIFLSWSTLCIFIILIKQFKCRPQY